MGGGPGYSTLVWLGVITGILAVSALSSPYSNRRVEAMAQE